MTRILNILAGFILALGAIFCGFCARADTTVTVSITVVEPIGIENGTTVPVPTDDGSINY